MTSSGEQELNDAAQDSHLRSLTRRGFLAATAIGGIGAIGACASPASFTSQPTTTSPPPVAGTPSTTAWSISSSSYAPNSFLGIYTPNISVVPGTHVPLYVAGSAQTFTIEAFRIGHYDNLGGTKVVRLGPFPVQQRATDFEDSNLRTMTADWQKALPLDTTGWQPGFYLVHAVSGGKRTEMPLVIRSDSVTGKAVVIMSETTMQAYNRWGGRSLYKDSAEQYAGRSYAVTTNRPLDELGRRLLYAFEAPVVRVAEESGVPVAYVTNIDVALNPSILDGATTVVSTGHDEYWPVAYRDALARNRDRGMNLAFLGANTGYWRVRVADNGPDGKLITCYKSAELDPVKDSRQTTARWRDAPYALPETTVVGQMYDSFPAEGDMEIRDPDFFLFKGTGVREGQKFKGLLKTETDRYYDTELTPHPLQVPTIGDVRNGSKSTWSTMTYYSTNSGAGVWSAGTMGWSSQMPRWSKDIRSPGPNAVFTKRVTLNMFREFVPGPVGRAHPATNDSSELKLPPENTTGSA